MKKNKEQNLIYKSIRKETAPPSRLFKNRREELLEKSKDMDYEEYEDYIEIEECKEDEYN